MQPPRDVHAFDPELARSWATGHIAGVEEFVRASRAPQTD